MAADSPEPSERGVARRRTHGRRLVACALAALLCLQAPANALAAGSTGTAGSAAAVTASAGDGDVFAQLEGKTAGVMSGTPQDQIIKGNVRDVTLQYFSSSSDMTLALETDKIDYFVLSSTNYPGFAEQYPDFGYISQPMITYETGAIFPKNSRGDELRSEFNAYVARIRESGELEELQRRWLVSGDYEDIDIPESGENGSVTMATSTTLKPFSFMRDGRPAGFDVAIVAGFCREAGLGLTIENVDFAGMLSGIAAEKYDIAAGMISKTEERTGSVSFSDAYYLLDIVAFVRADEFPAADVVMLDDLGTGDASSAAAASRGNALADGIRRTLLDEGRWRQVLSGLGVTLLITGGGFALANVLGAAFCAMSMSRSRALRAISTAYSALMQGLPVVVILMLLYYVAFGRARVDNVLVSAAGFGLVFGAYLAQLFRGGIEGVERGQTEAALASGLTPRQAFLGIVLPQAARSVLPGYFSDLISLLKGTSVVGYIAVMDLTRVGDIIRSNTFEAFVPLLAVAVIYLAIAGALLLLLRAIQARLDPGRAAARRVATATTPTRGGLA